MVSLTCVPPSIASCNASGDVSPCHNAEVTDEGVEITATVKTTERTGVEMEALTAVAVAGLAVIDMIKAIDRAAVISDVRVLSKAGGRRGDWSRKDES